MYAELINYAQADITRNSSSTESGRSRISFFFFFLKNVGEFLPIGFFAVPIRFL
jgi:hypothetical protein